MVPALGIGAFQRKNQQKNRPRIFDMRERLLLHITYITTIFAFMVLIVPEGSIYFFDNAKLVNFCRLYNPILATSYNRRFCILSKQSTPSVNNDRIP